MGVDKRGDYSTADAEFEDKRHWMGGGESGAEKGIVGCECVEEKVGVFGGRVCYVWIDV